MLVTTRKRGERFVIADDVAVTVLRIRGNRVLLGVEGPAGLRVLRAEIRERAAATDSPKPVASKAHQNGAAPQRWRRGSHRRIQ